MPGIRLIELRRPDGAEGHRFARGLTVTSTHGATGRLAEEVLAAFRGEAGADAVLESDGGPVGLDVFHELAIDRIVLRAADLHGAIQVVLRDRGTNLPPPADSPSAPTHADAPDSEALALAEDWDRVTARLAELASMAAAAPDDPEAAQRRVERAEMVLQRLQSSPRLTPEAANRLRFVHEELEAAQRAVEKRASRRAMKKLEECEAAERSMLAEAGLASYLDFVLGVATTGTPDPEALADAQAELDAAIAARDAAGSAHPSGVDDGTEARMMAEHAERIRDAARQLMGVEPGDDVATTLRSWRRPIAERADELDATVDVMDDGSADVSVDGSALGRDDVDVVLQCALVDHPWPEAFGPLPIVFDDALEALPEHLRAHALEVLQDLAHDVQIIVCSDDPVITEWGTQHPSDLLWIEREVEIATADGDDAPSGAVAVADVQAEVVDATIELDAAEAAERFELGSMLDAFTSPQAFESPVTDSVSIDPIPFESVVPEVISNDLLVPPVDLTPEPADASDFAPIQRAGDEFWGRDAEFDSDWLGAEVPEADDPFSALTAYSPDLSVEPQPDLVAEEVARREAEVRREAEAAVAREEAARIEAERAAAELAAELERMRAEEAARQRAAQLAEEEAAEAQRRAAEHEAAQAREAAARVEQERMAEEFARQQAEEFARQQAEELARQQAEELARQQAEAERARAEEERRLREAAELARREAEDAAIVARLQAEAQAVIAAENQQRVEAAERARIEAEALAQQVLARQVEIEQDFAVRAAAGDARVTELEAELHSARQALEESRLRAREFARLEAQEVAARDAEELSRRAAVSRMTADGSESSRRDAELAARRASAAAQRAEHAAARAEIAAQQEAEDARLLAQLEAQASTIAAPTPPTPAVAPPTPAVAPPTPAVAPPTPAVAPPTPAVAPPAPMAQGFPEVAAPSAPLVDPHAYAMAREAEAAEAAAQRAESAAQQIEFVAPADRAAYAWTARNDASEARRIADELTQQVAAMRAAGPAVDGATFAMAEQAARRAEISAARAQESASRVEWRALQDTNRERTATDVDAAASAAVVPSNLAQLEAAELEHLQDEGTRYELPQQEIDPNATGRKKRRLTKKAKRQAKQTEAVIEQAAKLSTRCRNHSLEDAVAVCGRCEGSFCRHCIVKVGSRGESLCVDCALQAAGVRSSRRRRH